MNILFYCLISFKMAVKLICVMILCLFTFSSCEASNTIDSVYKVTKDYLDSIKLLESIINLFNKVSNTLSGNKTTRTLIDLYIGDSIHKWKNPITNIIPDIKYVFESINTYIISVYNILTVRLTGDKMTTELYYPSHNNFIEKCDVVTY